MTVVKQVTQIRCDSCERAWIYPEGDINTFLVAHEWVVDGGRHVCPCCAGKQR